jgi:hypothetical protein
MTATSLKVVTLHESNYRDPVATLRLIADQMEAGKYGAVGCCSVVLFGDTLQIFGMGPDSESPTVHLVLCAAAREFEEIIRKHGQ